MSTTTTMSTILFVPDRQAWLVRAVAPLREFARSQGLILPDRLAVRVGRPQLIDGVPARGECWPTASAPEAIPTVVVSDLLREPIEILGVLLHELIHTADDCASQHGTWFQTWSEHFGLLNSPATIVGPGLKWRLRRLAWSIGPYPDSNVGQQLTASGSTIS